MSQIAIYIPDDNLETQNAIDQIFPDAETVSVEQFGGEVDFVLKALELSAAAVNLLAASLALRATRGAAYIESAGKKITLNGRSEDEIRKILHQIAK